jgi:hypothetical protein
VANSGLGTPGEVVDVANSAAGGDPWWRVAGTPRYDAEGILLDSGAGALVQLTWPPAAGGAVAHAVGLRVRFDAFGTQGRILDFRNPSNQFVFGGVMLLPEGALAMITPGGNAIDPDTIGPALRLGVPYWVSYAVDNVTAGRHAIVVQTEDGTRVQDMSVAYVGDGTLIGYHRFGRVTSASWLGHVSEFRSSSGSADLLPLVRP